MKKQVIILGAGGHAKVIADIVVKSGDQLIGFLDDNHEIQKNVIFDGKIVLGFINAENLKKYSNCFFVIAIGNNVTRELVAKKYAYLNWYTAIHPNAVIVDEVEIGEGSVVMAGVVINTGTKIGRHCIVNTSSSVDHDNILEDYVHVSPGAHLAGNVKVGKMSWICTGATVINNISIGCNNIIGAGAVVIRNINDDNCTFVGVPAVKMEK